MFEKFRNKIKIEYIKIKKPKKDEILIFAFPDGISSEELRRFSEMLKRAHNKDNKRYIVLNGNIDITFAKKPQINWRQIIENG